MLAYAVAAAAAVIVQAGGGVLDVHVGPLVLVAVERSGAVTSTMFGPGLLAVAALGGLANAAAAALLARRARRRARVPQMIDR
jgi:hypothetical protein